MFIQTYVWWWKRVLFALYNLARLGHIRAFFYCSFMPAGRSESRVLEVSIRVPLKKSHLKNGLHILCFCTVMAPNFVFHLFALMQMYIRWWKGILSSVCTISHEWVTYEYFYCSLMPAGRSESRVLNVLSGRPLKKRCRRIERHDLLLLAHDHGIHGRLRDSNCL